MLRSASRPLRLRIGRKSISRRPGLNEVGMQIVLTDPELNDLLNPESPSFLGEEYTKGILVMYLNAGKKDPLPIRAPIHERGRYTERVEHDLSTLRGL